MHLRWSDRVLWLTGLPSVEKLHLEKEHNELYETVLDSENKGSGG
jgi:hypothetical protein